jgi:DNA-binding response OmpR family regulator
MRILLIEDERDLLRILEKTFREESFSVDTACDGEAGLQAALAEGGRCCRSCAGPRRRRRCCC